jgi:CRISPR-associated endonuclease Csn1
MFSDIKYDINNIEKVKDNVEKKIEHITDTCIQKILKKHFEECKYNPEIAFSPDGIDKMNQNIVSLNNGKKHCPIYKVRRYEGFGKRFSVGQKGNKHTKYVEAAANTNLYFAVYETEIIDTNTGIIKKNRTYEAIPLNVVIERLKQGLSPAPADENGNEPLFLLSPNDLVFVPKNNKINKDSLDSSIDFDRLYKMVSYSGNQCFFIKASIATPIINKREFSPLNKMERALTGEMIKEVCIPIKVDRLGNIIKIGY